jgi:hypothetical protein
VADPSLSDPLRQPLRVGSAGVALFAEELQAQGVEVRRIDWRPAPAESLHDLERLAWRVPAVSAANDEVVRRMNSARPLLTGVRSARDVVPDMTDRTFLHAGPPIDWDGMSGPLRGAMIGAVLYEGLASDPDDAAGRAARGEFEFVPCHDRGAVGPMAGVVSPSMPVVVVENEARGNRSVCTFNEGLGKVLRYGAYDREVLERLAWMRDVLAPVFRAAIAALPEPIDLRAMTAQAIQMGDEGHNRNRAGTSLLLRHLLPVLVELDRPSAQVADVARFIAGNDHFFLNLTMPMAKATADAAAGVSGSSLVTLMARNGTEFGIRLSGTGERWFTGPSGIIDGLYLPGYGPQDANRDIGDSTITETVGLGGFAMAAAPAIVTFVGGGPEQALATTRSMYEIAWGESASFLVPALGFRGTPLGIDSVQVLRTSILPVVNTGIAHRRPGVGQIGAGLVRPPLGPFRDAVHALVERL